MTKLLGQLRPYYGGIGLVLLLVFLQTMSELFLPTLMADIVDTGIAAGNTAYILRIGLYMLLFAAGGMLCSIAASYFSAKISIGFGRDLRSRVFSHVENFSLQEFDRIGTASLITRTTNDITQLQQVLTMMLRMMVMAPLMMLGGLIMAISKDAELSLIFVIVIPLLGLAIFSIARKGMPLFKALQSKLDRLNMVMRENLTGLRVIRAFNRDTYESKRFDGASRDLADTAISVNKLMALMMPVMMLVLNFSIIAIIGFGSVRISYGDMQVGDLMAFIQYATQILFSFLMLSVIFVMVPRASASATRINEVLQMKPEIEDPEHPVSSTIQERRGSVIFDNVTFRYPGAEQPALEQISFQAKSGEVTAIIGGTGSGKSTLVNLIPRFYDVESGQILVDGIDIRERDQASLRAKIGYVPQKALLFTGTIAENIRYGYEQATDEEMKHAAMIAQASDFISEMKNGYDSVIAQGGSNVSGGQKQRLSIARALVRKPELYIFDDSFSALDFKTDSKLRAALKAETTDAAVLMIAQRVSTVMDADQILVLEDGKIVGRGTHRELLESSEVYREIVSSQLSEEEIA
ncbi:ATP-binding cassette subfamily B multidrug efflux pump [Paenibacillus sp. SORGH_AS306]|uniref:ABC transporter ATP-binding protein n=1 Tax=unclassified Paenibacillus TaxID=185978 RepID=UPI002782D3FF|nr:MULTISPECIES: ABC transporter ATP-binding protein [unclassified Paenibacillus]MDQ1236093.1 ATP-binding cassette subfamily B multidrug efflux pump [Paenibacillus sp. SORGH_AS_0306]MDR6108448.1 ATP-binding cassette subfamily B multidrug efflux pump [Paenibacillus sp. SORGH_AS_0338]